MALSKAVDEILNFAIRNEEEACTFYTELAGKMKNKAMSEIFEEFAREEQGHKSKLENVKAGQSFTLKPEKVQDLKIADYLVAEITRDELDYQHALILAMKKEKKAFKLYTKLSESAQEEDIRDLFLFLAQEEAKHKLRIELEYDENILNEN